MTDTTEVHVERRPCGVTRLTSELLVARDRSEVFAFFADAGNLEALTPPWLKFQIDTPLPIAMEAGALIDYRLRVRGIPIAWRTRIVEWVPEEYFIDEQIKGPYRVWLHRHDFHEVDGGTLVRDTVEFVPRGGRLIAPLVARLFVGRDVRKVFAFRRSELQKRFV
jgi:ligand-binding SRPBCC domain-containing protein